MTELAPRSDVDFESPMSSLAITAERYVSADQPLDCAGAYKIESLGIALFDRIESENHTAIMGLPLLAITKMLNAWGIAVP